jgi:dolichyl-phosphate beta-glucosyltransferase
MPGESPSPVALSIVIPAFKERQKIQRDIRAAHQFLRERLAGDGEIIVVDDGSPDDTADCARMLQREVAELAVIAYPQNRGKGHALRTGIRASRGRYVMFADAGLCVPFDDALEGIELCRNGADLAHGSRRTAQSQVTVAQPGYRRAGSKLFWMFVRAFMGIPRHIKDTQCGFKVYRGEIARELYGEAITDGFMFDIEVIRRAAKKRYRIAEFPVHWSNDADTRYRPFRGTLRNLRELVRIRASC